jgi:hypothetical protein
MSRESSEPTVHAFSTYFSFFRLSDFIKTRIKWRYRYRACSNSFRPPEGRFFISRTFQVQARTRYPLNRASGLLKNKKSFSREDRSCRCCEETRATIPHTLNIDNHPNPNPNPNLTLLIIVTILIILIILTLT